MRLNLWLSLGVFAFGTVACATASRQETTTPETAPASSDNTETNPTDPNAPAAPHALGTITLGEAHGLSGDSTPIISASFIPDAAKKSAACTHSVSGCEVADLPVCKTGTAAGCATGEVCTFDDSCTAKCVKSCTKACSASEECYFPTLGGDASGMACRKRERFDAGALAFSGTTTSLTMFPPYAVKADGDGAPFLAQSQVRVTATGAANAGFEKFDETFSTTTFLETNPPLGDISKTDLFGSGDVTVGWVPGSDLVTVVVSGTNGSAKCQADDTKGTFDIPRKVLTAVNDSATSTTPSVSISISRERHEIKKGKKTVGTLEDATVQSEGWLELVTTSSEAYNYQGCQTGYALCGDVCTSVQSDAKNCGACGVTCLSTQYCSAGKCY